MPMLDSVYRSKVAPASASSIRHTFSLCSNDISAFSTLKFLDSVAPSLSKEPQAQKKESKPPNFCDGARLNVLSTQKTWFASLYSHRLESKGGRRNFASLVTSTKSVDSGAEDDTPIKSAVCLDNVQIKLNPEGSLTIVWPELLGNKESGNATTLFSEYSYAWLKDHCRCPKCFNAPTNQRQSDTYQVTRMNQGETPTEVKVTSNHELEIHFPSHTTYHTLPWLHEHRLPPRDTETLSIVNFPYETMAFESQKTLWNGLTFKLPQVCYDEYMNEQEAEKEALKGLRDFGLLLVKNTPTNDMEATQLFGKKLGCFILPTLYGTMWSTHASRQESQSVHDTAYGSDSLECHTDCTYMRDPPGIQIFACAKAATKGGANRFVDGFDVLRQLSHEAISFFATHAVPFGCNDDGFHLHTEVPMIQGYSINGKTFVVDHFRHNDYDRRPLVHWDNDSIERFYHFQNELVSIIRHPSQEVKVVLQEGDMIVVDNHRVMHGRYGFEGTRILLGCYLNRDCVDSRIRTITNEGCI